MSRNDERSSTFAIPGTYESAVGFWESVSPGYPHLPYDVTLVDDLLQLLKNHGMNKDPLRIIDWGCGTGNPSIGLAERGHNVLGIDSDAEMLERFVGNTVRRRTTARTVRADWGDVPAAVPDRDFDVALCCGNSLIYAASWDKSAVDRAASERGINGALTNMALMLRRGGLLYIDITSSKELGNAESKVEFVGIRRLPTHYISIVWHTTYDWQRLERTVSAWRVFIDVTSGELTEVGRYAFHSFLLKHRELVERARSAGLELLCSGLQLGALKLYDGFLFVRRGGE